MMGPTTYVVRAAIEHDALAGFLERAKNDMNVAGVFSDPRIDPIAVCPNGPTATSRSYC